MVKGLRICGECLLASFFLSRLFLSFRLLHYAVSSIKTTLETDIKIVPVFSLFVRIDLHGNYHKMGNRIQKKNCFTDVIDNVILMIGTKVFDMNSVRSYSNQKKNH